MRKQKQTKKKQTNTHIHVPSSRNTLTETTLHEIGDCLRADSITRWRVSVLVVRTFYLDHCHSKESSDTPEV